MACCDQVGGEPRERFEHGGGQVGAVLADRAGEPVRSATRQPRPALARLEAHVTQSPSGQISDLSRKKAASVASTRPDPRRDPNDRARRPPVGHVAFEALPDDSRRRARGTGPKRG